MGNIEKIIQAIDIQLIQKNKPYMLLAEANRLLTFTRLIADNKALKKIVESGLIPHAYQTQKSPKQWKIPLSEKGKAGKRKIVDRINKERRKTNIQSKHKSQTNHSLLPVLWIYWYNSGTVSFGAMLNMSKIPSKKWIWRNEQRKSNILSR